MFSARQEAEKLNRLLMEHTRMIVSGPLLAEFEAALQRAYDAGRQGMASLAIEHFIDRAREGDR